MLFSKDKNFLFIHVPKTGGTSLTSILKQYSKLNPLLLRATGVYLDDRGFERYPLTYNLLGPPRHITAIDAKNHYGDDFFASKFSFAFVRNPWDLVISEFFYIKRETRHYLHKHVKNMNCIKEFLYLKKQNWGKTRFGLSQMNFVADTNGELILDFVGKFENYQKDSQYILDKIGLNIEIPHENITKKKHYVEYYDTESKQLVGEMFASDIEQFKYEFD
jgi:hypothetical protein